MKDEKLLHQQCDAFNKQHPSSNKGPKQFMVISGRIMRCNGSGKLEAFGITANRLPAPRCVTLEQSESNNTSQSKNVIFESQVAPQINETVLSN